MLDFYEIRWEYEPHSFPVQWDRSGRPTKMFTPDFYLPDADTYLEITTMSQKLVTRKNRKVRQLREYYPGINIKILYQRDYLHMVTKYGLDSGAGAPARSPTRTPGAPRVVRLTDRGATPEHSRFGSRGPSGHRTPRRHSPGPSRVLTGRLSH